MKLFMPAAVLLCAAAGSPVHQEPGAIEFDGYDVVVMGEFHDDPEHHVNQANWITSLAPRAVVFEMLTPELADIANRAQRDDPELNTLLKWEERGWPDFAAYAAIFAASPDAAIFGGDVQPAILRQALDAGAAVALGDSAAMFGLDEPLSERDAEMRADLQNRAHCGALPGNVLPGMVEAQRLRDAALARATMAALLTVGPPVAVITGNGHARTDWGMPAALRHAMPDVSLLSIGQQYAAPTQALPYDVLTLSAAPERADPCDAFR